MYILLCFFPIQHSKALQCYLAIVENSSELSKECTDDYFDVLDGVTGYLDRCFREYDENMLTNPIEEKDPAL